MKQKLFFCVTTLLMAFTGTAQVRKDSISAVPVSLSPAIRNMDTRELFSRKGKFFFFWGYNRAAYSNSDIHFKGDGYNFTITNITAKQEPVGHDFLTYIKPNTFTIPQFNTRIGYYINDKTFISFGTDHMKYSIDKQITRLTGTITKDNNNGKNIGTYNNTEVVVGENSENQTHEPSVTDSLKRGFVSEFEHCDGLNDVSVELGRIEQLWISNNRKHALAVTGTVNSGMLVPDTDADVLGYDPRHDMTTGKKAYHIAGYSFSASMGLEFDFYKNFFLLARLKAGYINLPDAYTTVEGGRASQHFNFIEPMLVVGYSRSFGKK